MALEVLAADLTENDEKSAKFEREAEALAVLNHPNIINAVDSVDQVHDLHCITMELVKGKPLTDVVRKNSFALGGSLRCGQTLRWASLAVDGRVR